MFYRCLSAHLSSSLLKNAFLPLSDHIAMQLQKQYLVPLKIISMQVSETESLPRCIVAESNASSYGKRLWKDSKDASPLSPQSSQQGFTAAWTLNWKCLFWITGETWAFTLQPWPLPGDSTESVVLSLTVCITIRGGYISSSFCYGIY